MPLQIAGGTILVSEHNYVSLFVTIEIAQDVVFVESSELCVGWHVNLAFELLKAAQDLVGHLNGLVHL